MEKDFQSFFITNFPKVKNFARRLLKSDEDAEDVAQDVFCKLWQQPEIWQTPNDKLDGYIFVATRNIILNMFKHQRIEQDYQADFAENAILCEIIEDDQALKNIYYKELLMILRLALAKMPSLGMLTINALAAADAALIPVQAQYLSAKGLEQLLQTVQKVRRQINPKLKIEGILLTMTDNRTNYGKQISNLIRQIVYVESRSALHTLLLRTDYLGVGILPILDQEKNYHIVSIPLPDSILSAEKGRSNYICSYIFPKGKELPKAARAYITFLEQCYGQNSDYIRQMPEARKSMEEIRRLEEED